MSFVCHTCFGRMLCGVSSRRSLVNFYPLAVANRQITPTVTNEGRAYSTPVVRKHASDSKPQRPEQKKYRWRKGKPGTEKTRGHRLSSWGRSKLELEQHRSSNRSRGASEPLLLGKDTRTTSFRKRKPWVNRKAEDLVASSQEPTTEAEGSSELSAGQDRASSPALVRHARKELVWLQDPLKLANQVQKLVDQDRDKALALVRLASKDMQCTVSWNHILNHHLKKVGPKSAWKLFNEMKKRAQLPDSYTYLIMLRGLADHAHTSGTLARALTIYHSMDAPNSKVPASVIHTNALLNVASRSAQAGRMDVVWSIVGKLEDRGPEAADKFTYSTLLNAIRFNIIEMMGKPIEEDAEGDGGPKEPSAQVLEYVEAQIIEAKKIWGIAINRWQTGDLVIDESLVCAMGRLLLAGSRPRDWDDIFSLIEQAMNIPRLVPRLGTAEPARIVGSTEASEEYSNEFEKVSPDVPLRRKATDVYTRPGSNTLSLLQEAALKLRSKQASTSYWEFLTDPTTYGLKPDMDNVNMRLRVLRLTRSTYDALELLRVAAAPPFGDGVAGYGLQLQGKSFRIALAACTRNSNDPNSLDRACQMVGLMLKTLPKIDTKSAYVFSYMVKLSAADRNHTDSFSKLESACTALQQSLSRGDYSSRPQDKASAKRLAEETRQYALMTLQRLLGTYDKFLSKKGLPERRRREILAAKRKLDDFVFQARNANWAHGRDRPEKDVTTGTEQGKFKYHKLQQMREKKQFERFGPLEQDV